MAPRTQPSRALPPHTHPAPPRPRISPPLDLPPPPNAKRQQGKAWQFKDWPFAGADKGEAVELFSKVLGLYPHYADEPVPANVRAWNVRPLPLARSGRHLDRAAMLEAWKAVDQFLAPRRCELEY